MPKLSIKDFSGGLNTFFSPQDIKDNQFQKFADVDNQKIGRIDKVNGQTVKTTTGASIHTSGEVHGQGHLAYRSEYDASNNNNSTFWWVAYMKTAAAIWYLKRVVSNTWSNIIHQGSGGNWTDTNEAEIDMYVVNNILRVSDGNFLGNTSNVSKWYGHIKREYWGKGTVSGIAYGANEVPNYYQPPQNESYNNWLLENQKLKPPICVKMDGAYDSGGDVDAVREVGIYVYDCRHAYDMGGIHWEDVHDIWPDAEGTNPFNEKDRYAVTYIYDYVQESGLSRDSDGKVGVSGFEAINQTPDDEEKARVAGADILVNDQDGILEVSTVVVVDDASVFKRNSYIRIDQEIMFITAISSETLTIERGKMGTNAATHEDDSDIYVVPTPQKARAINLVVYTGASNTDWNYRITGINLYWQPKGDVDWYLVESLDVEKGFSESSNAILEPTASGAKDNWGFWMRCPTDTDRENGAGTLTGGSATAWTDTGYFANTAAGDIAAADSYTPVRSALSVMWGKVDSKTDTDTVNFDSNIKPITRVGTQDITPTDLRQKVFEPRTDAVTCWYIPFDGLKIATYASLTGRETTDKIPAIRWKTSCVTDDGMVIIGNVDTLDENDQTVRERSRIYWTMPGRPDEFTIFNSRDIGRADGDQIQALAFWNGRVYVFKDRNTYVFRIEDGVLIREKHYHGYGCQFRNACCVTPYGVVVSDASRITLFNESGPTEISYNWRKTATSGLDSYQEDFLFSDVECLNEGDFVTHAKWYVTNDFDDSGGDATYTWSANQTSILQQSSANRAFPGYGARRYRFTYDLTETTAFDGDGAITITTGFAENAVTIDLTAGTGLTIDFTSTASPGNFVIQIVSGTDTEGTYVFDNLSLKQIGPHVLGYSAITNELYFIPDTSSIGLKLFKFDFDTKSWSKQTLAANQVKSNLQLSEDMEPTVVFHDTSANTAKVNEFNTGSASSDTSTIRTKKFDAGDPTRQKRNKWLNITYQSTGQTVTVKLYFDGNASADKTLTFAASGTLTNAGSEVTGNWQTVEVEVTCDAADYILDDCVLHFEWMADKLNA